MANTHTTLAGLFTDTANAIRSKTGKTGTLVADNFPTEISSIEVKENLDSELSTQDSLIAQINTALAGKVGKELPVLSNPAGAGNIEAGYQAIDGSGDLVNGAMVKQEVKTVEVVPSNGNSLTVSGLSNFKNFMIHTVIGSNNYNFGSPQIVNLLCLNGVITGMRKNSGFSNDLSGISVSGDTITYSGGFLVSVTVTYRVTMWN